MKVSAAEYGFTSERQGLGGLFYMFQEAAGLHSEALGIGMRDIGSKGLIWVAARQYAEIQRLPEQSETVTVRTWPGNPRHMLLPRFYVALGEDGIALARSAAIWAMVDAQSRKMINPAKFGFDYEGLVTGEELKLPGSARRLECTHSSSVTVPPEYLDSNRHMNNTRYYDVAESCLGQVQTPVTVLTEFVAEALEREEIRLSWGRDGGSAYICGESTGTVFRMYLERK